MRNVHHGKELDFEELSRVFVGLGLTTESMCRFPRKEVDKLGEGAATSMVRAGNSPTLPQRFGRIGFVGMGDDRRLVFMERKDAVENWLRLSKRELERVIAQRVIYTDLNLDGKRTRCYVQHDRMTNCLTYVKADDISQSLPTDINGVKIEGEQHRALHQGVPVEITVDGKPYTIGIDLQTLGGFSLVPGKRPQWDCAMNSKWGEWDGGYWTFTDEHWNFNHITKDDNDRKQQISV